MKEVRRVTKLIGNVTAIEIEADWFDKTCRRCIDQEYLRRRGRNQWAWFNFGGRLPCAVSCPVMHAGYANGRPAVLLPDACPYLTELTILGIEDSDKRVVRPWD